VGISHLEHGCAGADIRLYTVLFDRDRPKQAALSDSGVEVVDLKPRTGVVNVNSDEAEGA
jgi:hypothetical protein